MASLFVAPKQSPTYGGANYASAKFYLFDSGTLTPAVTYQDADLTTPHAHPVVADGGGVFPAIWLSSGVEYRVQLRDFDGVTVYDIDPYPAGPSDIAYLAATNVFTADQSITGNLYVSGAVNLGHASDTTLSRASAGILAVEGLNVLTSATGMPIGGTSTYTGTFTGCTTAPTVTVRYSYGGGIVTLNVTGDVATSNTTSFTITGAPAAIRPVSARTAYSTVYAFTDNGTVEYGKVGVCMKSNGTLEFLRNNSTTGFTNSGSKGPNDFVFAYNLT